MKYMVKFTFGGATYYLTENHKLSLDRRKGKTFETSAEAQREYNLFKDIPLGTLMGVTSIKERN